MRPHQICDQNHDLSFAKTRPLNQILAMNELENAAWSTLSIQGMVYASQQVTVLATAELGTVRWRGPRLGKAGASATFAAHLIITPNPQGYIVH